MKKRFHFQGLYLLLFFPLMSFGFDLAVTRTNESCPGNGSLSFISTNTDPNGTIDYFIYKLPDLTTPFASGPSTVVNGLTAGDYLIIARETVGSVTTTQEVNVSITSSFAPLTFTVQSLNQACSSFSTIAVTVVTGTVATYSIISGPATFSAQTSNTFSGLAAGTYRIRVIDTCGNAVVQAFTVTVNPTLLTTTTANFTNTDPPSCDFVIANNTIVSAPGTVIAYPLRVNYILHLPTGDVTIQRILNSGNPNSQIISQTIPFLSTQNYTYDVILTDACGITYPLNNFTVSNNLELSSTVNTLPCNRYFFTLNAENYIGSYTLQFTSFPPGFNPVAYNSNYPGPFNQPFVDFGSTSNFVPFGDYEVTITDSCGKTKVAEISIVDTPPFPNVVESSNGCLSTTGQINASIANYKIVSIIITSAPSNYGVALPHNVSNLIDNAGAVKITSVPLGSYTFRIVDDCGNIYDPVTVNAPTLTDLGTSTNILKGCDLGKAAMTIKSNNSKLTSVIITVAPVDYPFPIPHDISDNIIDSGDLYIEGLPNGNYNFKTKDECNFEADTPLIIDGYQIMSSSFSLVPDCGVFNIPLAISNNIDGDQFFGLQKLLDATTDTWGNPITQEVYIAGSVPNSSNSYVLQNNTTNLNLTFNGTFRIVHHFKTYNSGANIRNGLTIDKDCIEILSPNLSFANALTINELLRIPCTTTGNFDVLVQTNGSPPLQYRITEKDGNPFFLNNGNSNLFQNLTAGVYKFEVEDSCGNRVNQTFDVSDLSSLVTIYPVCNLLNCSASFSSNQTFDLTTQNSLILRTQSSANYTLSYHTSQADADSNSNPIINVTSFSPISNPQTIYIRLVFNQLPNCYQTSSFELINGQLPVIPLQTEYTSCDGQPVNLDASTGNLSSTTYSWSNGLTASLATVTDVGITNLTVTATNNYGSCIGTALNCSTSANITVTISDIPEIDSIDTQDWTDNENSITVITTRQGNYEYSLDGITFQESPVFSNLRPGLYTVYVRDIGGCLIVTQEVWLLNYPKFFTPNGDGFNETWFVKNSENEPNFKVYIFDRYGKLLTSIYSNEPGWDGKLNGRLLFSDDYWFQAYREDGRVYKGHFTLKR